MYKCLAIAMLSLGVSACNSTSEVVNYDDCINNNWIEIGYKTATSGKSVRHFNTYIEQCEDKLADNAKATYLDGFKKGIKEYCTYENGYKVGSESKHNNNTCPFELRTEFDNGYKIAVIKLKETKARLSQLSDDLEARKRTAATAEMAESMGKSK